MATATFLAVIWTGLPPDFEVDSHAPVAVNSNAFCDGMVCHKNAVCSPQLGRGGTALAGMVCRCRPGYTGDGRWCGAMSATARAEAAGEVARVGSDDVSVRSDNNTGRYRGAELPLLTPSPNRLVCIVLTCFENAAASTNGCIHPTNLKTIGRSFRKSDVGCNVVWMTSNDYQLDIQELAPDALVLTGPSSGGIAVQMPHVWSELYRLRKSFEGNKWFLSVDARRFVEASSGAGGVGAVGADEGEEPAAQLKALVADLTDAASKLNADVPMFFGDQIYSSDQRIPHGDMFPPVENQHWLPACTQERMLFTAPFVGLLGKRGRIPSTFNATSAVAPGLANPTSCFLKAAAATDTAEQAVLLAGCLNVEFGVACKNMDGAIENSKLAEPIKVEDEWGVHWRHAEWNCSVSIPADKPGTTVTVTALCQDPLRAGSRKSHSANKMALAPDDTGSMYKVVREPEVSQTHSSIHSADASVGSESNGGKQHPGDAGPLSWLIKGADTLPEGYDRDRPVVYEQDEVRDAIFVVGSGESMDLKPIEVFIRTLRATGCRAEVVAFLDQRCIRDFYPLGDKYGGIRFIEFDAAALEKTYRFQKAVVVYRFVLYAHYLQNGGKGLYRNCLHADLFDVYFQRDPFKSAEVRGGLALFAENPAVEMAFCRYHRQWFGQCKEWALLHRAHAMPRICMGVVLGTADAFVTFLQLTLFRMLQHCNDQGVLNILAASGQYAEVMPVTIYTPRDGGVLHVNTDWDFTLRSDGMVATPNNVAYSMVHQWDRVMKMHPKGNYLRPYKTDLPKRKAWNQNYWFNNHRNNWKNNGKVTTDCLAVGGISGEVVCRTSPDARHGSSYALFCPTHTSITPLTVEAHDALVNGEPLKPGQNGTAVVKAVQSAFLMCVSTKIMKGKCAGNLVWCNLKQTVIQGAMKACASQQSGYEELGFVGDNIFYSCSPH